MTNVEDTLALHQLQARYGHIMDARDFDALDQIFTDDAVIDFRPFDLTLMQGLEAIKSDFGWIRHPFGHHVTNIVADIDGDTATMRAKILVVLDDGSAVSGTYFDEARRTDAGWRIIHRRGEPFVRGSGREG